MQKTIVLIALVLLAGCSTPSSRNAMPVSLIDRGEYKVDASHPAIAKNERVRYLVFHYTAIDDAQSLRVLSEGDGVSSHYLINTTPPVDDGKPVVLQLVDEHQRAWHAGYSDWKDRSNINDTSIGIEIVNPGYLDTPTGRRWYPYTPEQIDLIARLSKDIIRRYDIAPDNVVGHSDISPTRKVDPGMLFPWQALAEQGVGAWPDAATVQKYLAGRAPSDPGSVDIIQKALLKYGFRIAQTGVMDDDTRQVISAFQLHFRTADFTGNADAETEAIALALVEKYSS